MVALLMVVTSVGGATGDGHALNQCANPITIATTDNTAAMMQVAAAIMYRRSLRHESHAHVQKNTGGSWVMGTMGR
jgi:hypothetical protein